MSIRYIILLSTAIFLPSAALAANTTTAIKPTASQTNTLSNIGLGDARDGSLLFRTDTLGRYIKAPTVSTDVKMRIAGPVIRTVLSQSFENISNEWVEGVYVFPLPENAAVDRLRIVVGGRFIKGQIKEKQLAKKIYAAAKAQGRKASLVEQDRPNIFTTSIANIGPHETVSIQIEYQDTAVIKHGAASLAFPMTVAPRYSPPPASVQMANANGHIIPVILDPVLDRARISPPLMDPKDEPADYQRLPVSIQINLDAGFSIETINSPYHPIDVNRIDDDSAVITLMDGEIPANRDFKLTWTASLNRAPKKSIFKETLGDDTYLMTMLTPPKISFVEDVASHKRETIFVIDTSGSMGGTSIQQAREALKLGLSRLAPDDQFNVIRFANTETGLFLDPKPASPANIQKALQWVSRLQANGGTNMAPAMARALAGDAPEGTLKQVIFITDGAIGNEQQLFAIIQDELRSARLFPVGIGSAPNRFFMSRAAKFGRGTSVIIGDISDVRHEMSSLFAALDNPVLTNLQISLKNDAETYPSLLPDLYDGEPVISVAKIATAKLPGTLSIKGLYPEHPWQDSFAVSDATDAAGLSSLWARRKIADLEERRFNRANAASIDKAILETALEHHLVSRLTSLVAVDITPSRDISNPLTSLKIPTQLPKGWDFATLSGKTAMSEAKTRSASPAQSSPNTGQLDSINMPRTASSHIFLTLIGSVFLGIACLFRRRRVSPL